MSQKKTVTLEVQRNSKRKQDWILKHISTNEIFLEQKRKKMQQPTTEDNVDMDPVETIPVPASVAAPLPPPQPVYHQSRYVNNMFTHLSFKTNTGAILQYVSNQCNDAPGLIGGIRLPVSDPLDIGGYITENWISLKEIGRSFLDAHMRRSNHHVGIGENLTLEDYSFGTSVASISSAARMLNPYGRSEAAMWALQTPTLLDPVRADIIEDGRRMESWQYVINGYIHLNESGRRANMVSRNLREAQRNRDHEYDQGGRRSDYDQGGRRGNEYAPYPNRGGRNHRGRQLERGGQQERGERGDRMDRTDEMSGDRTDLISDQIKFAIQENLRQKRAAEFPPTPVPTQPLPWVNSGVPLVPPARP